MEKIDAAVGKRFSKKCRGCQLFFTNIAEHLKKPLKSTCRSYYKPFELANLKRKISTSTPPEQPIPKVQKIEYEIPEELWKNKLSEVFSKTLGKIFCKICNSSKCDIKLHYKHNSSLLKCKVCKTFFKDINLHMMSNPVCKNFYQQNPSEIPTSEVSVQKFDNTAESIKTLDSTTNTFYQQNNLTAAAEIPQNYNVIQHTASQNNPKSAIF